MEDPKANRSLDTKTVIEPRMGGERGEDSIKNCSRMWGKVL